MVAGGSLLQSYMEFAEILGNSRHVSDFLGYLRISMWKDEEWFLSDRKVFMREKEKDEDDDDAKSAVDKARKAMLENMPEWLMKALEQFDSLRGIRLSLMRVFEQFQSELLCKNFCLHFLDLLVATLFPDIEVWSHLAEDIEESEDES